MPQIGPYRILQTLEASAASQVLLAMADSFGVERKVVLKRMLPSSRDDEAVVRRLTREATAYARLAHPSIVRMYDLFAHEGLPVLVLEYVDGPSLESLLISYTTRKQTLPRAAAYHVAAGIFGGLAAMHAARDPEKNVDAPIMHRNVSPGNVLLTRAGDVKLADFAFARAVGNSAKDTAKSQKGSMGYMAPEQALMEEITPATDVYCAALLLREMLSGAPAFPGGLEVTWGTRTRSMAVPELTPIDVLCPDVPGDVASALGVALRTKQEDRQTTAANLHQLLLAHAELSGGHDALKRLLLTFGGA